MLMIDIYCERTADGLFAEPLNLFSNLAFFAVFFVLRGSVRAHRHLLPLLYLILAVAIGSSLFHSFARLWALILDVAPISLFMVVYLVVYMKHVLHWQPKRIYWATALFVIVTACLRVVHFDFLNYSEFYFSPLLVIACIVVDRYRKQCVTGKYYLFALLCFVFALTLRIIDSVVCDVLPIGTHFFWHFFVAGCLYFCMRGLVAHTAVK